MSTRAEGTKGPKVTDTLIRTAESGTSASHGVFQQAGAGVLIGHTPECHLEGFSPRVCEQKRHSPSRREPRGPGQDAGSSCRRNRQHPPWPCFHGEQEGDPGLGLQSIGRCPTSLPSQSKATSPDPRPPNSLLFHLFCAGLRRTDGRPARLLLRAGGLELTGTFCVLLSTMRGECLQAHPGYFTGRQRSC